MMKVTVMYGHPTSPEQFEKYYATVHMPIAAKNMAKKMQVIAR